MVDRTKEVTRKKPNKGPRSIVPKTRRVRIVEPRAKKASKEFHKKTYSVHHPETSDCYGIVRREKNVVFNLEKGNYVDTCFVIYLFPNANAATGLKKGSHLGVDEKMTLMGQMQRIVTKCRTNRDAINLVPQLCGAPTEAK